MRIRYHGSVVSEHGLGYVVDYKENPNYLGNYMLKMDSGHTLMYARRESFDILEEDIEIEKICAARSLDIV